IRSAASCGSPGTRAVQTCSSVAPGPEAGCERDEESRVGFSVFDAYARQRDCKGGIEREAVEVDACAASDGIEMFGSCDNEQLVMVADGGVVPECIAFERSLWALGGLRVPKRISACVPKPLSP